VFSISDDGGDPGDAQSDALNDDGSAPDGKDSDPGDGSTVDSVASGDGEVLESSTDAGSDGSVKDASADATDSGGGDGSVSCSAVDVSACSHSPCVTGAALSSSCDSSDDDIVFYVCTLDSPACCSSFWSSTCVSYAKVLDTKCGSCI